jgi:hypothetical protein
MREQVAEGQAGDQHPADPTHELRDRVGHRVARRDLPEPGEGEGDRRVHVPARLHAPGRVDQQDRRGPHGEPDQEPAHEGIGHGAADR